MIKFDYQKQDDGLILKLEGSLGPKGTSDLWPTLIRDISNNLPEKLTVQADQVDYCDGSGVAFLLKLREIQQANNKQFEITGLKGEFEKLLVLFDSGSLRVPSPQKRTTKVVTENIGKTAFDVWQSLEEFVSFVGEVVIKTFSSIFTGKLRWTDTFRIAEKDGVNAIAIVSLMGLLIGLILAFQAAVAMRQFAAEIYVADLVVISLFRELGPLITAFIFASRSGSAFAAELGTMKVNEEVDALTTMGIDPIKFLAIPRIIASFFILPLLTAFNQFFGLIGCGLVMLSLGFVPATIMSQMQEAAGMVDFFGGMIKTFVFGFSIALIGCLRGFQTGNSASAVGDAATKAVVSSIVAIIVIDGIFAVVYYYLGI